MPLFAPLFIPEQGDGFEEQGGVFVKEKEVVAVDALFQLVHLLGGEGADQHLPEILPPFFAVEEGEVVMDDGPGGGFALFLVEISLEGDKFFW
jgi:hypothetical protein